MSDILHEALSIVEVKFQWVKYITDWTRSGPAGVAVTKSCQWERRVLVNFFV